jgi:hypothetical protein
MSRGGLGRNDPCPCGSGRKYKKCCYPRTFPDFSKPNAGLPDPFEEREAAYRAFDRQEAQLPRDENVTIDTVDVGRSRVLCAPLAPYGDLEALPGTLAPPTPLQVETKYEEIRDGNPEGATEVVVEYTYPDLFGFAEARAVFDADDCFQLVDGQVVSVLDLFRGMQVQMSRGRVGTIRGNPQRRYDVPVAPLPDKNGLWSSRVTGLVKHTAHEVVEFRWAGQMVRVTPGHVVWSADRRGWVGAHELLPGELIRVAGNVIAPVEGVRRVPGFLEVFGIEVEYFHNYFVGTGDNAMLVHNGPEKVARPVQAVPGMAAPGVPNPEVIARVSRNPQAVERAVAQRMRQLGVEEEVIGIKGMPGVEEGAFTRYHGPQGGGNIRPDHPNVVSGRWRAGINVDEAVFDPTFQGLAGNPRVVSQEAAAAYHEAWARASNTTRMDAVIAHEYTELRAVATPELQRLYGPEWPHYAAVKNAPDTTLKISNEARELLRLQRRALGLE